MADVATTTETRENDSPGDMGTLARHDVAGARTDRPAGAVALLGSTVDGDELPRVRRRLTPASYRSDALWGWLAPLAVTLCAGILQFWNITTPHSITFDETYYAKDAYSLLVKGYAVSFINDPSTDESEADQLINGGDTDPQHLFAEAPNKVVHP